MNRIQFINSSLIITLLLAACVDPFTPEIDTYEDVLVVEAMIGDDPSSQMVKLTRTRPLYASPENPGTSSKDSVTNYESGAIVSLTDSQGNKFNALEKPYGKYLFEFNPAVNEKYTLSITTADGRSYISDSVKMKSTPPIENVFYKRKSIASDEIDDLDEGFQIYVNTGTGSDQTGYYKFEWEETWEIVTPYHSFFDFDLEKDSIFEREGNLSNCWKQSSSTNLNVVSSENLSSDRIQNHPVRFISFNESLLRVKYSILVKQYSLSQDGFYFWKNLEESNESAGSLYDKQPSRVLGNIKNENDPSEPVLGYFDMATVASRRIFISKQDHVPNDVRIPSVFTDCLIGADSVVAFNQIPELIRLGYLISYYEFGVGYHMVKKSCIDCRIKGSNIKPEFWDE